MDADKEDTCHTSYINAEYDLKGLITFPAPWNSPGVKLQSIFTLYNKWDWIIPIFCKQCQISQWSSVNILYTSPKPWQKIFFISLTVQFYIGLYLVICKACKTKRFRLRSTNVHYCTLHIVPVSACSQYCKHVQFLVFAIAWFPVVNSAFNVRLVRIKRTIYRFRT